MNSFSYILIDLAPLEKVDGGVENIRLHIKYLKLDLIGSAIWDGVKDNFMSSTSLRLFFLFPPGNKRRTFYLCYLCVIVAQLQFI